ncbi:unnamed protein product [Notodromas monacha]|uniref:Potassium channel domain-containing protein n=1 Tax=Notodromas monacha TaxID=399045 RepID=A0A7R9BRP7_9CRUS|nr:unnamed protein product [Notodromas monacha]CAG0920463.1 unnamed protein product [Notodromas monacha]
MKEEEKIQQPLLTVSQNSPEARLSPAPSPSAPRRPRKSSVAPQPPSSAPPPLPTQPPPPLETDLDFVVEVDRPLPPPVPPRTLSSALAVAKFRKPLKIDLTAPLTPKPPRPNSQIIIPTDEDLKKNKKYYDLRMWKMGLDDMRNLKGDLLDHVQKVKEATTKSLSIPQRILLWLSDTVSSASSKWFTHILLMLSLFLLRRKPPKNERQLNNSRSPAYKNMLRVLKHITCSTLEGPHEENTKIDVEQTQDRVLTELWRQAGASSSVQEFKNNSLGQLEILQQVLYLAYDQGITKGFGKRSWTFWGSTFYSGTIITTIGYGHIAPVTSLGRIVTIIYALFGIPILLMSLADFGKLFTRMVKAGLAFFRRLYYTGTCKRARRTAPLKLTLTERHGKEAS